MHKYKCIWDCMHLQGKEEEEEEKEGEAQKLRGYQYPFISRCLHVLNVCWTHNVSYNASEDPGYSLASCATLSSVAAVEPRRIQGQKVREETLASSYKLGIHISIFHLNRTNKEIISFITLNQSVYLFNFLFYIIVYVTTFPYVFKFIFFFFFS